MDCRNHPGVPALDRCAGCAEAFCGNCLVELHGRRYCGSCKTMAVQAPPPIDAAMIPCKEASDALKYAIIGIFCLGIILGPVAISKALQARKMMETNPRLSGSGKASAAIFIGIVAIILWAFGVYYRVSTLDQR
ncbi:MAG: hypothetical protein JW889_10695 [Verrucomicrobia bacterium]|nr:hypothetical protein [Verrucomicrobiota bacterium]